MAILILAGSLLLSIAQNNWTVLFVTAALVTFSTVAVDWIKLVSFHPLIANTLAFVVSFISFTQFVGGDAGTKLNAVANLLTYLQLVLLLQKKSPRLYWQIMMLSLLQVVVAAALNLDFGAGMVFFGYIILVVIGTIHLKIYRGNFRLAEKERANDIELEKLKSGGKQTGLGVVTFRASELDFRNEKKIAWQGFLLCFCALFFSFAVFFSIPRFGSAWYGPDVRSSQQTGFTTEIRFDDDGFLAESNKDVLRATFLDENDQPMELAIEPYFRGLILTDYEPDNGAWTWRNNRNFSPGRRGQRTIHNLRYPDRNDLTHMRQIIRLDPGGQVKAGPDSESIILFSLYPAHQNASTPEDLVYNRLKEIMFADESVRSNAEFGPYNYEVLVPLYRRLGQLPAIPIGKDFGQGGRLTRMFEEELNRLVGKSVDRFYSDWLEVTRLGGQLVSEIKGTKNRRVICNKFVNFLKGPDFQYTRDLGSIERDKQADPIVDFLTNHKSGHCEYFATALALLLRSQDIPCRVITGYRGGEYNPIGGFYDVKEKHAHVWVEAYLPPEECDDEMLKTGQANQLGAWLRLDPTPGSDLNDYGTPDTLIDRAFDTLGFVQKVWDDYVMGLDQDSRDVNGFDPTKANADTWGVVSIIQNGAKQFFQWVNQIKWWQWLVCSLALILIILSYASWRAIKRIRKTGGTVNTQSVWSEILHSSAETVSRFKEQLFGRSQAVHRRVEFYEDFLQLLSSLGLDRRQQETSTEFAEKVVAELKSRNPEQESEIVASVEQITRLFYLFRFGKQKSADQELMACELKARESVQELKQLLKKA